MNITTNKYEFSVDLELFELGYLFLCYNGFLIVLRSSAIAPINLFKLLGISNLRLAVLIKVVLITY